MVGDPDPPVRYQLAFSLGALPAAKPPPALAALAVRDGGRSWVRMAILSSVAVVPAKSSASSPAIPTSARRRTGRTFLTALAAQAAANRPADVDLVVQGARRSAGGRPGSRPRYRRWPCSAGCRPRPGPCCRNRGRRAAGDPGRAPGRGPRHRGRPDEKPAPRGRRRPVAQICRLRRCADCCAELLASRQPADVQTAAVETLASFRRRRGSPAILLQAWAGMSPRLRATAAEALFARPAWIGAFLDAVEKGTRRPRRCRPGPARVAQDVPRRRGSRARLHALRRRVGPPPGRGRRLPEGPGHEGRPRARQGGLSRPTAPRATASKTSASKSAPSSRRSATAASTRSCSTSSTPTARSCRSI